MRGGTHLCACIHSEADVGREEGRGREGEEGKERASLRTNMYTYTHLHTSLSHTDPSAASAPPLLVLVLPCPPFFPSHPFPCADVLVRCCRRRAAQASSKRWAAPSKHTG